jgi:5S rRNA maturation endonuclease (ribonuclease M5)/transcription elongation factor Elf1
MDFQVINLLQELLGSYSQKKNEYLFNCAFCHHSKKKLSVNINSGKWKCWVCGARGKHIISLFKKLNISRELFGRIKDIFVDVNTSALVDVEANTKLLLPSEYKPLWVPQKNYIYFRAIKYLKSRGITTDDVLRYRFGYCETGNFANMIIIPSYDKSNQLNYFIARTIYDSTVKYKNPPVSKNIVAFENLVCWSEPIVLVEGFFDAIAIKRNAIPLLGKTLPTNLERAIIENDTKAIIIFLDSDAKQDAIRIHQRLTQYSLDVKIVFPEEQDAAELGFIKSWEFIDVAKPLDFKDTIIHRLQAV